MSGERSCGACGAPAAIRWGDGEEGWRCRPCLAEERLPDGRTVSEAAATGGDDPDESGGGRVAPFDALRAIRPDDPQRADLAAAALCELARSLAGKDRLARVAARETAISALTESGLSAPARMVDAALDPRVAEDDASQGRGLTLADPEPWPQRVAGGELLDELRETFARYLALPPGADVALALWTVWTWSLDAFYVAPLLALVSPTKRCGKTTALAILDRLVRRSLPASNITPAATFRTIEAARPTLLVDEADSFLRGSDELRGILNSGHTRGAAYVVRTVGEDYEPRRFSTWGAKAVAMIGRLPDTLEDRALVVPMRRRALVERVKRLRLDDDGEPWKRLRRQLARWAADQAAALREVDPDVPAGLHDRAADNWRPLLAIAEVAGGAWPEAAKQAACALAAREADAEQIGVMLLGDVRDAFGDREHLLTDALLRYLHGLEDRPWGELGRAAKPLSATKLASLLRPFGPRPQNIRDGERVVKGYRRLELEDAWARYLPAGPLHRYIAGATGDVGDFQAATPPVTETPCSGSDSADSLGTTGDVAASRVGRGEPAEPTPPEPAPAPTCPARQRLAPAPCHRHLEPDLLDGNEAEPDPQPDPPPGLLDGNEPEPDEWTVGADREAL